MPLAALSLSRAVTVFSSIKRDPRWSPFCLLCHKRYKSVSLHHKTSCWSRTVQLGHKEQWQYFPQIHLLHIPKRKPISLINDISGGNKIFIKLPNDSTVRFHFFNQQVTGQNCTFSPWSNPKNQLLFGLVFHEWGLCKMPESSFPLCMVIRHSESKRLWGRAPSGGSGGSPGSVWHPSCPTTARSAVPRVQCVSPSCVGSCPIRFFSGFFSEVSIS